MANELGERVAKLEQASKGNSSRIKRLETESEALIRLTTLVELQTEVNRENSSQMRQFGVILDKVNSNLSNLNSASEQMKNEVVHVSERVEKIEQNNESQKVDIPQLMVKIVIGLFMLIPYLVGAYLLFKFQWK